MLPDNIKTKVKERLRDARFVAREMRPAPRGDAGDPGGSHAKPSSGLARIISEFSEGAFQTLETVAIGLLSSDPGAHFGGARAYPLSRYLGPDRASSQAMFARDCYFAAKQMLLAKGVANPRVREELFAAAYRLASQEWDVSASDREDAENSSLIEIARDAAVMSSAILRARPVAAPLIFEDLANSRMVDAGLYVASALGLATAVATYHGDLLGADDPVYPGVYAAVDARYVALEKAAANHERPEELARVFADLTPHLP